jgi:hypothetical protein
MSQVLQLFKAPGLLGDEGPELVQVDGGAAVVGNVGVHVEVPHAHLSEVPGVVLVEVDPDRVYPFLRPAVQQTTFPKYPG